jgi:DNA polymerase elongation subunit (family B)
VIVDDDADSVDRVRLPHEKHEAYDTAYYTRELRRAAENILAPLGWDERDIQQYLADRTDASLVQFE